MPDVSSVLKNPVVAKAQLVTMVLASFMKHLDKVTSFDDFDKMVKILREQKDSKVLDESFRRKILNFKMKARSTQQNVNRDVYNWCMIESKRLDAFLCVTGVKDIPKEGKFSVQWLLERMKDGLNILKQAIENLSDLLISLGNKLTDLTLLGTEHAAKLQDLENDTEADVSRLRTKGYLLSLTGALVCAPLIVPLGGSVAALAGLGGLGLSVATAAGVLEGTQIPMLRKEVDAAREGLSSLEKTIKEIEVELKEQSKEIESERKEADKLHNQVTTVNNSKDFGSNEIKIAVKDLIEKCQAFVKKSDDASAKE